MIASALSLSAGMSKGPPVTLGPLQLDGLGFATIVTILLYLVLTRIPNAFKSSKTASLGNDDEQDKDYDCQKDADTMKKEVSVTISDPV